MRNRHGIPVVFPNAADVDSDPAALAELDQLIADRHIDEPAIYPKGPVSTVLDVDQAGGLKPGDEGYWPVYGARADDIEPGDLVMSGWKDEDDPDIKRHAEYEVVEMSSWGDLRDSCRVRFLTTAGQLRSVGRLQPMALCRRGTHSTLSGSVR